MKCHSHDSCPHEGEGGDDHRKQAKQRPEDEWVREEKHKGGAGEGGELKQQNGEGKLVWVRLGRKRFRLVARLMTETRTVKGDNEGSSVRAKNAGQATAANNSTPPHNNRTIPLTDRRSPVQTPVKSHEL